MNDCAQDNPATAKGTPASVKSVTLCPVNTRTRGESPGAQGAHAAGPAAGGAAAARRQELRQPQPARGHARGRRRPDRLLPPFRQHGGARPGSHRRVLPNSAGDDSRVRAESAKFEHVIRNSVEILVSHVHEHRLHFRFIARERFSGVAALRHAIRAEIRLFASELATDLVRVPDLSRWSTEDLRVMAGLIVNAMVSTTEEILDTPTSSSMGNEEIRRTAQKRMRMIVLARASGDPCPPADPVPVLGQPDVAAGDVVVVGGAQVDGTRGEGDHVAPAGD